LKDLNAIPQDKGHSSRHEPRTWSHAKYIDLYAVRNLEDNEWHSATARTVDEAKRLVEAGFEICHYLTTPFKKRKWQKADAFNEKVIFVYKSIDEIE